MPYVAEQILKFEDAYKNADALAIAPYFGMNVPAQGEGLNADTVSKWSVDQVLDYLEQKSLPESLKWIADNKKIADQYGVKLIAYEAGQHAVGIQGGENNDAMTKLFLEANQSARMGQVIYALSRGLERKWRWPDLPLCLSGWLVEVGQLGTHAELRRQSCRLPEVRRDDEVG
jgi:hypothetical protein